MFLDVVGKVAVVMLHVVDGWGQQFLEEDLAAVDGVVEVGQAAGAEAEALVDSVEEEGSPVAAADRRGEYQLQ